MKEKLYTIPLNDAVNADEECPFCFLERKVEQDLLDFALGNSASYMESDVRESTDSEGFCRAHFKKMFDYGNTLGNGWILKTHYLSTIKAFDAAIEEFVPHKPPGLFGRFRKVEVGDGIKENAVTTLLKQREESCYICNRFREDYERYLDTFFGMYLKDDAFRDKIKKSKGFCLTHFQDVLSAADEKIPENHQAQFYKSMFALMRTNLRRIEADVAWLVEKFDYNNQNADWKNSKDAIQRGMQKLKGGYPADAVYKKDL
jgi:hypothetical protein